MRYFLIAGEASGDLLASQLMRGILNNEPSAEFEYWGGDAMAEIAPGLKQHYKDIAIMGFLEVLLKIREIKGNINRCKSHILNFKPDVLILVDYPGFNMRMAKFGKENGIKTCYYIAPKIWAWNEARGKKLEKYVDLLLLIFPFEANYFKKWKVKSVYVGNPLVEQLKQLASDPDFYTRNKLNKDKPLIALLPGSRKQEVKIMLPIMLSAANHYPEYQFIIAGAPGLSMEFYAPYLDKQKSLVFGETHQILKHAIAAVVCSGTASLETAILGIPQVCVYAANPITYAIAKRVVKVKYASLVNLNLDKLVVVELIQKNLSPERILQELKYILPGGLKHKTLLQDYDVLNELFGNEDAANKAAKEIAKLLKA